MHDPSPRPFTRALALGIRLALSVSLPGCTVEGSSFFGNALNNASPTADMSDGSAGSTDMATGADCRASIGLPGTRLLCVDFDGDGSTFPSGWTPKVGSGSSCMGWEVGPPPSSLPGGRALQMTAFNNVSGVCGFQLPMISLAGYQRVTLSIDHVVDFPALDGMNRSRLVEIYPTSAMTPPRLALFTGRETTWQRFTVVVRPADLGGAQALQPLFSTQLPATSDTSYAGWRIRSIAVMGE